MTQFGMTETFLEVLFAEGPPPHQKEKMMLYNSLLGSWDVDVCDYAPDGTTQRSTGEWHFSWVLEGRAIQDVFIVPSRANRNPDRPGGITRYGTTLRVYDPAANLWHITWINPVNGAHNRLIGAKFGDEIVHEGVHSDGSRIRWIFSNITADSFQWRGERSKDEGKTWTRTAEFAGRRMGAASSGS